MSRFHRWCELSSERRYHRSIQKFENINKISKNQSNLDKSEYLDELENLEKSENLKESENLNELENLEESENLEEYKSEGNKVNKQDFLQVFQGSGIRMMEDNLTSVNPLSYTTNGSWVDLGSSVKASLACITQPHHVGPRIKNKV